MALTGPDTNTQLDLTIGAMIGASCGIRVEKKLNQLEGASAAVNYATGLSRSARAI